MPDLHRVFRHVRAKQRQAHDAECDGQHLLGGINGGRAPGVPLPRHGVGLGGHDLDEPRNARTVEGGLQQATLVQPRRPVVGEQTLAQQVLKAQAGRRQAELIVLLHEHLLDRVRIDKQNDVGAGHREAQGVAQRRGVHQEFDRIVCELARRSADTLSGNRGNGGHARTSSTRSGRTRGPRIWPMLQVTSASDVSSKTIGRISGLTC